MNITTKFSIGQKPWILATENSKIKPRQVTILEIEARVCGSWDKNTQKEEISIQYFFEIDGCAKSVFESQNLLFETREQLIKSILEE